MSLISTAELVASVPRAVAAFNVITLEHAEAIVMGAESAGSGVIMQISQNAIAFHGGRVDPIAAAAVALAGAAGVPVAVHLDHVDDDELLHRAADAGFSSVMYDAGALPYAENVVPHPRGRRMGARQRDCGSRPNSASSAASRTRRRARTPPASAPTRRRRSPSSRRPAWTRWPSRSAVRMP